QHAARTFVARIERNQRDHGHPHDVEELSVPTIEAVASPLQVTNELAQPVVRGMQLGQVASELRGCGATRGGRAPRTGETQRWRSESNARRVPGRPAITPFRRPTSSMR